MKFMHMGIRGIGVVIGLALLGATQSVFAGDVLLAENGRALGVIVIPAGGMEGNLEGARFLRESVADLTNTLGRMTGIAFEIVESGSLPRGDQRTPIFIGSAAAKVFGAVGVSKAGKFGFRVVADGRRGIGLYGESEYGTSYAIYELLHRLGCRWFMPGELGVVIPSVSTLTVPVMDAKLAPATEWRRMENRTADADFRRRNRMGGSHDGGNALNANQGLPLSLKWWSEEEANRVADDILTRLDKQYSPTISLSPGDGVMQTEDTEGRKYDPEPRVWEPAANQWSVTDRVMMLCNRVAERVGKKYPDVLFGVLAYVNFSLPPVREKIHPNVIPVIAPIDFNRHHPMTWPNHPNDHWLLDMVQGWGKKASRIGYYAYGMNLAELSAPCPFITKWGEDIPIIMSNNCAFWMPETMNGWESMMPGFYLSIRMTFYPQETPEAILADLWPRVYGPAAEPMARYWNRMDRAWGDAREYAGSLFGYLRMFTPEVLSGARADINEALKLAGKPASLEYRRVKLIDLSLTAFERFMKMRRDWAAGRLAGLAEDYEAWKVEIDAIKTFQPDGYLVGGLTFTYTDSQIGAAYRDGARMAQEMVPLAAPLLRWQYQYDREKNAAARGWTRADFDDWDWPTTHVVRETWSTIGHHNTMSSGEQSGRMAYRTTAQLEVVPKGKKVFVWIGATDGSAKLFVNGQHVKYVVPEDTRHNKKGDVMDAFSGYCQPAQWDVTDVVKPGTNPITILCERTWLNELGTGGLMGPVMIYRER